MTLNCLLADREVVDPDRKCLLINFHDQRFLKLRNQHPAPATHPANMDQEPLNIGNCPHCTNIVFKNGAFNSNASFTMRCPSCQKLLEIEVRTKIEITIKQAERYISPKKPKFGKLSIAFLLPFPTANCVVCACLMCTHHLF